MGFEKSIECQTKLLHYFFTSNNKSTANSISLSPSLSLARAPARAHSVSLSHSIKRDTLSEDVVSLIAQSDPENPSGNVVLPYDIARLKQYGRRVAKVLL